ncbi:MAG: ATP12 family chaperone protein [Maricaulaceae bacterium]
MTPTPPRKRFYQTVEAVAAPDGWTITLDGRTVKTPARQSLVLPTAALARLCAQEWDAQAETIRPETMTVTKLANLAIDRVPGARAELAREVRRYGETDAICYLAEGPAALVDRQTHAWTPLRDWAAEHLGVRLTPTQSLNPPPQPETSLQAVETAALSLDDFALAGLSAATPVLGSAVLALALFHGRLEADAAFAASRVEEDWQTERWGADAEASARADRLLEEVHAIAAFWRALGLDA